MCVALIPICKNEHLKRIHGKRTWDMGLFPLQMWLNQSKWGGRHSTLTCPEEWVSCFDPHPSLVNCCHRTEARLCSLRLLFRIRSLTRKHCRANDRPKLCHPFLTWKIDNLKSAVGDESFCGRSARGDRQEPETGKGGSWGGVLAPFFWALPPQQPSTSYLYKD